MEIMAYYDELCACIRSLNGIHAALAKFGENEDELGDFFDILDSELQKDFSFLQDLKKMIRQRHDK